VNWITYARDYPGQYAVHRMAQANFNIRGWQGRWRYTASTALFFPDWIRAKTLAMTGAGRASIDLPADKSPA
jgi:hypothetical protein